MNARQPIPIITAPEPPLPSPLISVEAPGPASVDEPWRPADSFDPIAHVNSMSVIELAALDLGDLHDGSYQAVDVSLPYTEAALAAVIEAGGEVRRAYSSDGYYAYASVDLRRVHFKIVGPKYYGPRTLDEEQTHIRHVRAMRAEAVKADERVGWGCEAMLAEVAP